jgi:hypothetical protein
MPDKRKFDYPKAGKAAMAKAKKRKQHLEFPQRPAPLNIPGGTMVVTGPRPVVPKNAPPIRTIIVKGKRKKR